MILAPRALSPLLLAAPVSLTGQFPVIGHVQGERSGSAEIDEDDVNEALDGADGDIPR